MESVVRTWRAIAHTAANSDGAMSSPALSAGPRLDLGSARLYVIVFLASACTLVLEIVAGRLLAPQIGVSIYTWTSIIGIVLAGISVGNYLGGRLADRFPPASTLGLTLLAASLLSFAVLALLPVVPPLLDYLPLVPHILAVNAALFFLPSCILGMVTPLAIKQALTDLDQAGGLVGRLYAVSTAGSILGVYLTGFVLIPAFGTRHVVLLVGFVLLALALTLGSLLQRRVAAAIALIPTLALAGYTLQPQLRQGPCLVESSYYCIQVSQLRAAQNPAKVLKLDHLIHSYNVPGHPDTLTYPYTRIFAETAQYVAQRNPAFRALFIGGGGYTVPIHLEARYPQASVEVIEIDPGVTAIVREELGLSPATGIVTYNEDGRMAIRHMRHGAYDLIVGDAFNDYSVPYHLTTLEFSQQLQELLSDEGIYIANIIDKLRPSRFLRAFVYTLESIYPHVYIMGQDADIPFPYYIEALDHTAQSADETESELERELREFGGARATYVVAASRQPIDFTQFHSHQAHALLSERTTFVMAEADRQRWLQQGPALLLTDDHAPVDTMVASLFTDDHVQWRWRLLVPPSLRWLLPGG